MYIDTNGRTRPEAAAYISSIIATRSAAVKVKRPQPLGEDDRAETTPKELLQDEIHNDLSYKEGECDIVGKNAARAGCSIHDGRDVANSEDARSGDNFHSARHDARPDPVPNNNTVWTDARPDPVPNNNKNKGAGRYEQEEAHARKDIQDSTHEVRENVDNRTLIDDSENSEGENASTGSGEVEAEGADSVSGEVSAELGGSSDRGQQAVEAKLKTVDDILAKLDEKTNKLNITVHALEDSLEFSQNEIDSLKKENAQLKKKLEDLELEDRRTQYQINTIDDKVDRLETVTKKRNLIVEGIPEPEDRREDVEKTVSHLFDQLAIPTGVNFEACYRVGTRTRGRDRPILMSFEKQSDRDLIYSKRFELKRTADFQRIWLNEDLGQEEEKAWFD